MEEKKVVKIKTWGGEFELSHPIKFYLKNNDKSQREVLYNLS